MVVCFKMPGDRVERSETCAVNMELDKAAADRYLEVVKLLTDYDTEADMLEGDTIHLNYTFCIEYLNNVVSGLRAVNTLCNAPEIVLSANCALLEEGQCLAFEVLANLEELIQTIKER